MDDLIFATAQELALAISSRKVSAREVLEAHIRQTDRYNPALNAVVTLDIEGSHRRALAADTALGAGEVWGPLHGVPITVKDAIATEGMRTTAGHPPLRDHVPLQDATVVARLRAAGAIILGKTNMQELGMDFQSTNPLFGRTNNPWNLDCTSGGSTGGGAASLAAGMIPLTLGSDSGGSVRIPAHFCGVYALKPTEYRIPTTGHTPELSGEPRALRHLNTIGPMARSVGDLILALTLTAGPDRRQWEVPPVPLEPQLNQTYPPIRVAWTTGFSGIPVSADTREALSHVATTLADEGCLVDQRDPDVDFQAAFEVFHTLFELESGMTLPSEQEPNREDRAGTPMAEMKQYALVLEHRDALIGRLEQFFDRWDVLLCPVSSGPAFSHRPIGTPITIDEKALPYRLAGVAHCSPFNLTGHPAVVLPIALNREGLPIGMQIVGRRWSEMKLLSVTARIASVLGRFPRPPGY